MTPSEQHWLYKRLKALEAEGFILNPDSNRWAVYLPDTFTLNYNIDYNQKLFVSSESLEAAICAAEVAADMMDVMKETVKINTRKDKPTPTEFAIQLNQVYPRGTDQRIGCVKLIRQVCACSLKEAKDAMDQFINIP